MRTLPFVAVLALIAACSTMRLSSDPYVQFDQAQAGYNETVRLLVERVMPSPLCDPTCDAQILSVLETANPAVNAASDVAGAAKCRADQAAGKRPTYATPCPPALVTDSVALEIGLAAIRSARDRLDAYVAKEAQK